MNLQIPAPTTPAGKTSRRCPAAACVPALFQLGSRAEAPVAPDRERWIRRRPGERGVTCPYCGTDADDDQFWDPADFEHAKQVVAWAAKEDVADELARMFGKLGRSLRGKSSLRVQVNTNRRPSRKPVAIRRDLLRDLTCDACGRAYGVFAIGLFCPDCGSPNAHVHFKREVELIAQQLDLAEDVGDEGSRELAYRLLGNAHEDVLTALETYLKATFRFILQRRRTERLAQIDGGLQNAFQNLDRGKKLFVDELGFDPFARLTEEEHAVLRGHISKRHVVGHNLGMVDEKYARTARKEPPGQIVHLVADEIRAFAELAQRIVMTVVETAPEFRPGDTSLPATDT